MNHMMSFTTGALSTLIFSSSWSIDDPGNILVRQLVSLTGGILSTVLIAWLKHRWKDKGPVSYTHLDVYKRQRSTTSSIT